ncbi:hypothetical protein Tco_1016361 [Tanacetum coccineum]|uniref:Uncharacterized protein n=1 Tax=Tanacetum coccineum TaxID=301880 RepID=A0ABQ5FNF1_9ASTR
MHHHTCNLLPHDQVRLPDTKAKRSPNQLLLNLKSVSEEDSDPKQARGIRICKRLALLANQDSFGKSKDDDQFAGARETVGSPVVQQNGIHANKAEQGVPLQAEQADWLEDTDEEIDEQELEAYYSYMAKIQEVSPTESSSTHTPLEQIPKMIPSYPANRFASMGEMRTLTLEKRVYPKWITDKVKPIITPYQNSLYETFKPPSKTILISLTRKEVRNTMRRITIFRTDEKQPRFCKENASNVDQKEREAISEIQDFKAQMQDRDMVINELNKFKSEQKESFQSLELRMRMLVCAECEHLCSFNHDALCFSILERREIARTKKPHVVPISASKPKRKVNKSVPTPHKKIVASDTTIQKSKSYYKELYENTNQEMKCGIAKNVHHVLHWDTKAAIDHKEYGA